jgi:hypothetical protein
MRRFVLPAQLTGIFFAVSAGVGIFSSLEASEASVSLEFSPLGVVAIPAAAAILYFALCVLFPSLIPPGRLAMPLNFTQPVLFAALLVLVTRLLLRPDLPMVMSSALANALLWRVPMVHFVSFGMQLLVMTVIVLIKPAAKPKS